MTLTAAVLLNLAIGGLLVAALVFLLTHGVHRDRHHRARLLAHTRGSRRDVAS